MCSSCAKKAQARGASRALSLWNSKKKNNPKRLQRLLAEATRKGDQEKINEITKRINGDN